MASLNELICQALLPYAGAGVRSYTFPSFDDEHQTYLLVSVDFWQTHYKPKVIVMARVVGQSVIIEQDVTPNSLADYLAAKGIPDQQIIRVYEGQAHPEAGIPDGVHPELDRQRLGA